jgi:hypothetical protein
VPRRPTSAPAQPAQPAPSYPLEFFLACTDLVPPQDEHTPFPAKPSDPLSPLYALVQTLWNEAAAYRDDFWVRAETLPTGKALVKRPDRHDVFLAVWRSTIWARVLSLRQGAGFNSARRRTEKCLSDFAASLSRAETKLSEAEVLEIISHAELATGRGSGFFPGIAFAAALEWYSRKAALPREAAAPLRTIFDEQRRTNNPSFNASLERIETCLRRLAELPPESDPTPEQLLAETERLRALGTNALYDNRELRTHIDRVEKLARVNPLPSSLRSAITRLVSVVERIANPSQQRLAERLDKSLSPVAIALDPGEHWSEAVLAFLAPAAPDRRAAWTALLTTCTKASGASPTKSWLRSADEALAAVGSDDFAVRIAEWFALADKGRTAPFRFGFAPETMHPLMSVENMTVLQGLCWTASRLQPSPHLARSLADLALSANKKVPNVGPRAVRVGNAAIYALSQLPGPDALAHLARLKVKLKSAPAQKTLEKALAAVAERQALPRDELEELAVPTYGLSSVGLLIQPIVDVTARLEFHDARAVTLSFINAAGKPLKSAPAALKSAHADELKNLKLAAKDIAAMLSAQRDRLDGLFLSGKSWPFSRWRDRYLDHPVLGVLARRLIWWISRDPAAQPLSATWLDGALVDQHAAPIPEPSADAAVALWHPLDATLDQAMAWRRFFEDRALRQPFKQAHREVYLLADAERATATYSNRFAAHVLRQHQFHALALQRGWRNSLRLAVDAEYAPPSKTLPHHNLHAEFLVEPIGDHTNDAGVYEYLATDQVRFYDADRTRTIHLDQVPPLALSEILRDADLFVGVASIGNNADWQDGGPNGRFRDYWWSYSFADTLSGTALARRDTLSRLLPRLNIADRCSLDDRFLIVRGRIRTYKIHLGSGNILMSPDDQYLCIVPSTSADKAERVALPFEGDRTLSIILSKAFLLAADDEITDHSITHQLRPR